jgi:hypothetical protein
MKLFLIFFFFSFCVDAKVDPKNYDFSTDTLAEFFPGKEISVLETKYGKAEVLRERGEQKMLRFWVAQIRYKFPVIIQTENGKVLDMFAKLPSYFLHDVFHHSLIKRWGQQKIYKRVDEEAYYRWEDEEKIMHYSASCTITCFPIYFTVSPAKNKTPGGFISQHDQLNSPSLKSKD